MGAFVYILEGLLFGSVVQMLLLMCILVKMWLLGLFSMPLLHFRVSMLGGVYHGLYLVVVIVASL